MRDNGQMINVRDSWPFPPFTTTGGGGLNDGNSDNSAMRSSILASKKLEFGGEEGGGEEDCDYLPAPKVIISHDCQMLVTDVGNAAVDPPKQIRQVSVLGGELIVANADFINGQSNYRCAAISASRGKCRIYGTIIDDFWTAIYKGSDVLAQCTSEGLILTGSQIKNPQYWVIPNVFGNNEFAIYNVSANLFVKGNIIEGIIRSEGISYGALQNNNIIKSDNTTSTVWIDSPEESMRIIDNRFYNSPTEYYGSNVKTDVTCNTWEFVDYGYSPVAVVAGGYNQFPMSWGTMTKASGNLWETLKAEMYDFSTNLGTLTYYYRETQAETFDWFDINEESVLFSNPGCTYIYPEDLGDLDTTEYVLSISELESEYGTIDSLIQEIKETEDTMETTVQEEIADLERQLSDLVGKGMLFDTSTGRQFWAGKANVKVIKLSDLNNLWYAHELDTIKSVLENNSDLDAQVLYDATGAALDYIDSSDLYSLSVEEVTSLDSFARSSSGDYTNILRNFLYMVYDSLITWDNVSVLDSMRDAESLSEPPSTHEITVIPVFSVYPNPFTENIEIDKLELEIESTKYSVEVLNLEGKVISSSSFDGSSDKLTLVNLEPGFYIVKIRNLDTGRVDVHKVFKSTR